MIDLELHCTDPFQTFTLTILHESQMQATVASKTTSQSLTGYSSLKHFEPYFSSHQHNPSIFPQIKHMSPRRAHQTKRVKDEKKNDGINKIEDIMVTSRKGGKR
jgi:hypothetical protein